MEFEKAVSVIETMLFAAGRVVKISELINCTELSDEDISKIIETIRIEYEEKNKGIEIIKVDDGYQMCTKKEFYEYIYPLFDNRAKPSLSNAAMETLSIIAYNPKITRSEIEAIRGVSVDGTIYKLLEYNLIEESGKLDAPGRPTTYRTTSNFLKMFGISSLDELPELPKYKMDENEQIVLEEFESLSASENLVDEINTSDADVSSDNGISEDTDKNK